MIMNDIVNDKKGHNFEKDKTYWFTGILWYNIFSFFSEKYYLVTYLLLYFALFSTTGIDSILNFI